MAEAPRTSSRSRILATTQAVFRYPCFTPRLPRLFPSPPLSSIHRINLCTPVGSATDRPPPLPYPYTRHITHLGVQTQRVRQKHLVPRRSSDTAATSYVMNPTTCQCGLPRGRILTACSCLCLFLRVAAVPHISLPSVSWENRQNQQGPRQMPPQKTHRRLLIL